MTHEEVVRPPVLNHSGTVEHNPNGRQMGKDDEADDWHTGRQTVRQAGGGTTQRQTSDGQPLMCHWQTLRTRCAPARVCTPVEAAEDVKAPVLPAVEVHAEDGGEDEQHHGEVEHHHHRGLQGAQETQPCPMEKAAGSAVQRGIMGLYKGGNIGLKSKSRNNHEPFVFPEEKQTVEMAAFSINASAVPSVREHFHIAKPPPGTIVSLTQTPERDLNAPCREKKKGKTNKHNLSELAWRKNYLSTHFESHSRQKHRVHLEKQGVCVCV